MKFKKPLFTTEGIIKRHPDGFGFLIPKDPEIEDVYIPKQSMEGVMTNDLLAVKVFREEKGEKRFFGEVLRVVKRANSSVYGKYHQLNDDFGLLYDQENHWGGNLSIPTRLNKSAKDGELVHVKILAFPGDSRGFTGEVIDVIGDAEDPLNDIKRAIISHQIPEDFSPQTRKEVRQYASEVSEEDFAGRTDLRKKIFCTIDGVTAKDFDDAICVEQNQSGFRTLVAIADVSHYVKSDSFLDRDAYEKGNSTYFPGFVVPMLPEELSNELCSLKPNVNRLAMVADMQLGFDGSLLETKFYEAVIISKARVTYGEAQDIIDDEDRSKHPKEVQENILCAADLARILMAKRFKEGSLDLEVPETEVVCDEAGLPIDIVRTERVFAHKLIEELMLIANIAVARSFAEKEVPAMYRVHESPDREKIALLESYMESFGEKSKFGEKNLQKKITKTLKGFSHKPQGLILNMLVLRAMKQAQYSTDNVGHFGLNFSHYSHFTSPIRRYPDLIVHRILKHLFVNKTEYRLSHEEELRTMATHCSATEQRSVKAERLLISIKRARFIQKFIGQEFEAMITSVTKFGVFVSLRQFDIDGLVKVEELGNDFFEFNEDRLELVGKKTKLSYQLGMPLNVVVANANPELGQIDFVLAGEQILGTTKHRKTNNSNDQKRQKAKKDRKRVRKSRVSKPRRKSKAR